VAARALLAFMASPAAAETKRRHGMDPFDVEQPADRSIER